MTFRRFIPSVIAYHPFLRPQTARVAFSHHSACNFMPECLTTLTAHLSGFQQKRLALVQLVLENAVVKAPPEQQHKLREDAGEYAEKYGVDSHGFSSCRGFLTNPNGSEG
jgi:hypothetical protein